MSDEDAGYILTEIWNAKPSWLALSADERRRFFEEKVHPFIGRMIEGGAEMLGCAINDNASTERIDYRYMAVWKLPDKALSERSKLARRNWASSTTSTSRISAEPSFRHRP